MKKIKKLVLLIIMLLFLTGCGKNYKGYWCNYEEKSSIQILLTRDATANDKKTIEEKIDSFENVSSSNYYSREDFANEFGLSLDDLDMYDAYVVNFESMDNIGTYSKELASMNGVLEAKQISAKTNISLYNIESWGKYTYTDSDEATANDLETGKYKKKKGVITFTPDEEGETKLLYIKDGLLCGDSECNKIYAKSTSTCTAIQEEK